MLMAAFHPDSFRGTSGQHQGFKISIRSCWDRVMADRHLHQTKSKSIHLPKRPNHSNNTYQERSTTMLPRLLGVMLVVVFALSIVSVASAQDKKMAAKKSELKSVSCDPACGFMVRSHDEKELTSIVITHAKSAHNKDVTADDVKAMMKTASPKKSKTT
jgi:predicted small metal-binding protein